MTKPIIIAEAGINHNGDFDKAMALIRVAHECRADYVKFHAAYASRIKDKEKFNALWSGVHGAGELFSDFVKRVELSTDQFKQLFAFAQDLGIGFMVTPYDLPALEEMLDLGIRNIKLASCDLIKDEYIKIATRHADCLVLSTGMAHEDEIGHALELVDRQKTYVLHCVSEYPAPLDHSNLRYMQHLRDQYKVRVGFSDHTDDILVPLLAVAHGAIMIEKHFMLDDGQPCPDQKVSVTKAGLAKLVYYAKHIDEILGSGSKDMSEQEINNRQRFRHRWR